MAFASLFGRVLPSWYDLTTVETKTDGQNFTGNKYKVINVSGGQVGCRVGYAGKKVLYEYPGGSYASFSDTHAPLVTTVGLNAKNLRLQAVFRALEPKRLNYPPKSWEVVGWVGWRGKEGIRGNYWGVLKRTGWQLERIYSPGLGEEFLVTSTTPKYAGGQIQAVEVEHIDDTISMAVNGRLLVDAYVDNTAPNKTSDHSDPGEIWVYTEDGEIELIYLGVEKIS